LWFRKCFHVARPGDFELYEHTHPTARAEGRLPIGLQVDLEMVESIIET
jgi:hypothetical protein